MLAADFFRAYSALIAPRTDQLVVGDPGENVTIEVASIFVIDEPQISSVGITNIISEQRKRLQSLLDRVPPGSDAQLGCTKLIEHRIEVGNEKPIRKRYYPVWKEIGEEMHSQVRKMLDVGIIRRSNSQ